MRQRDHQSGFSAIVVTSFIVLAVTVLAVTGLVAYWHHKPSSAKYSAAISSPQTTIQAKSAAATQPAQSVYTGWKTYTSANEKASFQYPSDWKVTKPVIASNDTTNTDQIGINSPTSGITISWVTDVTGFGNEHTASYPLITVLDKTPITHAPGHFVVSGITTIDGDTYHPWLAVQNANGILANGVKGDLATFTSLRSLNPTTHNVTGTLLATCGPHTWQDTPALSKDRATAYFSDPEVQQAKLILLSYNN